MNPPSSNVLPKAPAEETAKPGAPSRESASSESSSDAAAAGAAAADEKLLTTGDMARLSNSTLRTVRFYEEEGILRPAKRTDGGHRLFRRTELDRLLFVTDLRTAGLSLDEIKEILELKKSSASGSDAAKTATRIFGARIQELQEKVAVLSRLRDEFTQTTDIVTACLDCSDHERFPNGCGTCSVMTSHSSLPRSTRVVWAVGSMPLKPHSIAGADDEKTPSLSSSAEVSRGPSAGGA